MQYGIFPCKHQERVTLHNAQTMNWGVKGVCGVQKLMADGGPSRFYRGFTPCLARAMPANGVMLYTVDTVTTLLNK